ncbi:rhombosortase [Aliidiomarina taiwanensis]|uniref:rhombosortase n=1 Tax=Aliidiomarina taiwanensis TaxID=946228 RepID=UPI0013009173|nr:rhombosortase [Aliidiomarina taiwanensis]
MLSTQLPLARHQVLPFVVLSVFLWVLFLVVLFAPAGAESLLYQRHLLERQIWRVFTGQFMHLDWPHLLLNTAGVWLAWLLFAEHLSCRRMLWLLPVLALGCGIGMWVFAPEIEDYLGFSGVLYGVFAFGAVSDVWQKIKFGRWLLVGVIVKVSWDYWITPVSLLGGDTSELATAAHLLGAVSGVFCAVLCNGGMPYLKHK